DPEALVDDDVRELAELARELESEERTTEAERRQEEGEDGEEPDDDDDSWVDELESLSEEERAHFEADVRPIKRVLVKVRKIAFRIIHSTTKLLPEWRDILKKLKLKDRLIPRDVRTRWNSTFDMADFVIEYREAIEMI
ncbi:hypothetical protein OH76DRAFT_1301650, partial [Lentinus brumalis]